jgi:hypothetical protein
MSQAEKRYCKLYLKTFSGKDSNKTIQDLELLERVSRTKDTNKRNTIEGNSTRLYYKLLDALFLFHQDHLLPDEKLFVRRARLLYNKGLYAEADRIASRILKQQPSENHLLKIEVIELRILNALKNSNIDYLKYEFNSDKKRLKEISKEYFNLVDYETLWASVKLESTTSYFFGNKNSLRTNLLTSENKAISPTAKILFNKIKGFLSIKEGDYPAANFYANRTKHLYEQHPYLIKKDPGDYLRSIRNICISLIFNKMYAEAEKLITELSDNPIDFYKSKNADVVSEYFTLQVLIQMDIIISSGKMHDFSEELLKLESKYNSLKDILPLNEALNANLNFALINIYNGNYRKALKQINFVLKNAENFRKDVYHLALISELVIHFYIDNISLLESRIVSLRRLTNDPELPFGFEKELPSLFTKLLDAPQDKAVYENMYQTILNSLEKENKMVYQNFISLFYLRPKK